MLRKTRPRSKKAIAYQALALDRRVAGAPAAICAALVWHCNLDTGQCYPGIERIGHETGYSRRAVLKALKRLEDVGYIKRLRHAGRHNTNAYLIAWQAFEQFVIEWESRSAAWKGARSGTSGVHDGAGDGARQCPQTLEGTPEEEPVRKKGIHEGEDDVREVSKKEPKSQKQTPRPWTANANRTRLPSSREVVRNKANARIEEDLRRKAPDLYDEVLNGIPDEIWEAARDAEVKHPGSGLKVLLKARGRF